MPLSQARRAESGGSVSSAGGGSAAASRAPAPAPSPVFRGSWTGQMSNRQCASARATSSRSGEASAPGSSGGSPRPKPDTAVLPVGSSAAKRSFSCKTVVPLGTEASVEKPSARSTVIVILRSSLSPEAAGGSQLGAAREAADPGHPGLGASTPQGMAATGELGSRAPPLRQAALLAKISLPQSLLPAFRHCDTKPSSSSSPLTNMKRILPNTSPLPWAISASYQSSNSLRAPRSRPASAGLGPSKQSVPSGRSTMWYSLGFLP
mmetsp:Transcript_100287/g.318383  ORF Transcript_100287/g.318383 Transcript_100287/m.318383 type:complete len:264 (+) Transcript_100287:328-1119(+)